MKQQLVKLLKEKYNISFHEQKWLEQAFTHSSYVNEHRKLHLENNERLEFLGDAVLELIVSDYLFLTFPDLPEGKLTKLRSAIVREDSLAKLTQECGFDEFIRLGKGEENSNARRRPSLLCDLFESFLGALYLDQGVLAVTNFLKEVMMPKIEAGVFSHEMDHKTKLQEVLQRHGDVLIQYQLVKEEGPAHDRIFFVEVYSDGALIGKGCGKSKKQAEQEAAKKALMDIKE